VIETVDRLKLAGILATEAEKQGRAPQFYVHVNTGAEPQKAGVAPEQLEQFLRRIGEDHGLSISGVMCIPPLMEEPALHFALLEKLARANGLQQISCGMSADYDIAIGLGATQVRVGTAIFGPRVLD